MATASMLVWGAFLEVDPVDAVRVARRQPSRRVSGEPFDAPVDVTQIAEGDGRSREQARLLVIATSDHG